MTRGDATSTGPGQQGALGLLRRITRGRYEAEADELIADATRAGATPIRDCPRGTAVTVCGRIRSVVIEPKASAPSMRAEVYDGTGLLTVIWMGRRRVAGIEPGRSIVLHGRLTCPDGELTVFNPRYELRPSSESARG